MTMLAPGVFRRRSAEMLCELSASAGDGTVIAEAWHIREDILREAGLQKIDLQYSPGPMGGFTDSTLEALRQRRIAYLFQESLRANQIVPLLMQMEQIYEAMILLTKEILALRPGRW